MTPQANPIQPQGIDAILAGLSTGGAPLGQMGKVPVGINPSAPAQGLPAMSGPGAPALLQPSVGSGAVPPGAAGGMIDPLAQALSAMQPDQLQLVLNALLRGGAFNSAVPVG